MTENEKHRIVELKVQGLGYRAIAKELGIAVSTVSSYLRRIKDVEAISKQKCKCCGLELKQTKGHRQRVFCSDKCRIKWWKNNKEQLNKKKMIKNLCPICHKEFFYYPGKIQKFCSWNCYLINKRGGVHNG